MNDPNLDNTVYYFPLLLIILYMILIYVSYVNVATKHFESAYCDNKTALMEQETSRYNLKGMSPTMFWILVTILCLLMLYYILMFVLKIVKQFYQSMQFIVPINWVTFVVVTVFIGLLMSFMFSNRSIPEMDYALFTKNVDSIFSGLKDCNYYAFATQFDELPPSLQTSILQKYKRYRQIEEPYSLLTEEDLRDELRKELGPDGFKKNIHKYLNFPHDIHLINHEYGIWLEKTSEQMKDSYGGNDAAKACLALVKPNNDYIPLDLVNNSSMYMKNLKTIVTITWILLAIAIYPIYSNNYMGTQIQKISFVILVLIGMALLYYFLVVRSE